MPAPLARFIDVMERFAPLAYAESWDNVGLLIGRPEAVIERVMLTIDMTEEIAREAAANSANLVISYHPVMYRPIQRITDSDPGGRMLLTILNNRISIYSPHTALDAAAGGVTDWLADALGSGYRRPLKPHQSLAPSQQIKVVTFVPGDKVDRVRDALASAGAGQIGAYELCSFFVQGTGTFRGGPGTKPAVGEAGRLERVDEIRLEMVCPRATLHVLVTMLKKFHPYEEPAFDLYELHPVPELDIGAGRKVVLDQPASVGAISNAVKKHLGAPTVKTTEPGRVVKTVAVVPGAGASLLDEAIQQGCQVFITGEMTHHQALDAELRGCSVILTGHTNSERGYLPILKRRLEVETAGDGIEYFISEVDRTRFQMV